MRIGRVHVALIEHGNQVTLEKSTRTIAMPPIGATHTSNGDIRRSLIDHAGEITDDREKVLFCVAVSNQPPDFIGLHVGVL